MVNISIDVTDLGGEARPGDKVVLWKPAAAGSATHAGRVISTAPVDVFLTNGKATVPDVEPGSMSVLLQCRGVESQGPIDVTVPDGTGTVTLRSLIESQFEYSPPIVSAVQEAADNAAASERAAIQAQVRSEAAADRAETRVDEAINNGANLIRAEVKQDADRAVSARQAATQAETKAKASENAAATSESNAKTSETNAKQSEDNAGDYAAVATTAATEAVDAMERATEIAGGDFATRDYVNQKVSSVTLTGTGFPEGNVAAPVGAVYTDSAATNGAIRWIKTRGTGSTGWEVEWGDTGWRNITADLMNGWNAGGVHIRRVGRLVQFRAYLLDGRDATSGTFVQFPTGFGNLGSGWYLPLTQGDTLVVTGTRNAILTSGKLYFNGGYHTSSSVIVSDSWPTTLPGTPT